MRLLFISDKIGVYKAITAVLKILRQIEINLMASERDIPAHFLQKDDIFVIEGNEKTVSKWLWGIIRVRYLNPVIVIGYVPETVFLRNNPAFREGLSKYHRYLELPLFINRLLEAIDHVGHLYDDDTRQIIFDRYGTPYIEDRLYRLIEHDLKLCDKDRDMAVLKEALKYADELNNSGLHEKLQQAVKIRKSDDLKGMQQIKSYVLDILKEGTRQ